VLGEKDRRFLGRSIPVSCPSNLELDEKFEEDLKVKAARV